MLVFRVEMARATGSKEFAAGVAGFVLCALVGVSRRMLTAIAGSELLPPDTALECIDAALESRYLLLALPVLAALPYASSVIDDVTSHFARSYLPRCGTKAWTAARVAATALSGGLTAAVGGALVILLLGLLLLPAEMRPDPLTEGDSDSACFAAAAHLFSRVACLAASGTLWALVGSAAAALTMNRYVAFAAPFILYYVLVIVTTRYFPALEVLNPQSWASPRGAWREVPYAAWMQVMALSSAVGFALMALLERRVRDA